VEAPSAFDGINNCDIFANLVNFGSRSSPRNKTLILSAADLIDVADHVEGDLGQVVVLALQDLLEAGDGLLNGHQLSGVVCEHLRNLATLNNVINFLRPHFFPGTQKFACFRA
jgi:hypothetical protein